MGVVEGIGKMIGYLVLVLSLSMICESKFNTCQRADHICEIAKLPNLEPPPCCDGYVCQARADSHLQFFLKFPHSILIRYGSTFENLPHTGAIICSSSSFVQFLSCQQKFVLTSFKITLKVLNSSVQGIDLKLSSRECIFLFFKLLGDGKQLLVGLV